MIKRFDSTGTFHRAVVHQDRLLLSGLTGGGAQNANMRSQTAAALQRADALLQAHGSDKRHVLRASVYVTDMTLKDEMNEAWLEYFGASDLPARATIGVADLGPGLLIEIVLEAIVKH